MKGREAFANGKRRKIEGKENSTLSVPQFYKYLINK